MPERRSQLTKTRLCQQGQFLFSLGRHVAFSGDDDDDDDDDDGSFLADEDLLGRWMVNSCMFVGGCRDRFLMRIPYRTLDRRRFGNISSKTSWN